jgi:hypothetical protein
MLTDQVRRSLLATLLILALTRVSSTLAGNPPPRLSEGRNHVRS